MARAVGTEYDITICSVSLACAVDTEYIYHYSSASATTWQLILEIFLMRDTK